MKTYLALSLLSSLLLTSCSVDWNDANVKKIGELENKLDVISTQIKENKVTQQIPKQSEDDLFKKKQECLKYKNDMLQMASNVLSEDSTISGKGELEEVFYSKHGDSCYFIVSYYAMGLLAKDVKKLELFDFFKGSSVAVSWNCQETGNCTEFQVVGDTEYDNKIKELKGE